MRAVRLRARFLTAALICERFIPSYIYSPLVCKGNNPFYGNKRRRNIYPGVRMERLKELAAKQSGAINAREERLFAANTRTYYPLIIPRRER